MLRIAAAVTALMIGTIVVSAQNLGAIKQRQEVMDKIATASSDDYDMMKGEAPFDLAKLQASLKTMESEAMKIKALFPPDSKTGGDTARQAKDLAGQGRLRGSRRQARCRDQGGCDHHQGRGHLQVGVPQGGRRAARGVTRRAMVSRRAWPTASSG